MAFQETMNTVGGALSGGAQTVTTADWSVVFKYIIMGLFLGALIYMAYHHYKKHADLKYKAFIRFDTQNGIKGMFANIVEKKENGVTQQVAKFIQKYDLLDPESELSIFVAMVAKRLEQTEEKVIAEAAMNEEEFISGFNNLKKKRSNEKIQDD